MLPLPTLRPHFFLYTPRLFTCAPPLLIIYILIITFVNALSFDFYFGQKISKAILIRGIMEYLHGNNPFLELEQSYVPNSTSCSTNSTVELLHGGVRGAELQKLVKQSQTPSKYCYF